MRPKKDEKDREVYFHYTFYLLMRLISCYTVYTEKQLSEGRADCIVETPLRSRSAQRCRRSLRMRHMGSDPL